jgi:signal peptidase II
MGFKVEMRNAMTKTAKTIILCVFVLMTVGCDHVTKHIATTSLKDSPGHSFFADTVRLEYAENTGGMLSLGGDLSGTARAVIFKVGVGIMLFGLAIGLIKVSLTRWAMIGLSLAWAGGISNWIDRVISGSVVDFMNVGIGSLRTGIFNVADIAVFLGAFVFIFSYRPLKKYIKN